jgi:hypothetical protein
MLGQQRLRELPQRIRTVLHEFIHIGTTNDLALQQPQTDRWAARRQDDMDEAHTMIFMDRFQPGETVIRREILRGEVWFAEPMVCVADTNEVIATYTPPGARFGFPATGEFPAGRHPWQMAGKTQWQGHGKLHLMFPDVDHAVFVFWSGPDRDFAGWYFNLQDAPRRTSMGFDTLDHELDLWWPAGQERWEWKDLDKLTETGDVRYPGRVDAILAEGVRIAALLDDGNRWWDQAWARWCPEPGWDVPVLPEGWEKEPFETR